MLLAVICCLFVLRRSGVFWLFVACQADCLDAGCCYDPHPAPDPRGFPWCYANASLGGPGRFYVDIDYFITASEDDPQDVPFVDQVQHNTRCAPVNPASVVLLE